MFPEKSTSSWLIGLNFGPVYLLICFQQKINMFKPNEPKGMSHFWWHDSTPFSKKGTVWFSHLWYGMQKMYNFPSYEKWYNLKCGDVLKAFYFILFYFIYFFFCCFCSSVVLLLLLMFPKKKKRKKKKKEWIPIQNNNLKTLQKKRGSPIYNGAL